MVAVVAVAVAIPLVALLLLRSASPRIVGGNGVRSTMWVTDLTRGHPVCMALGSASSVPDGARITVGTAGAGPQPLEISFPGSKLTTVIRDYQDGDIEVPLRTDRPTDAGSACITNLGRAPVKIGGEAAAGAMVDGKVQQWAVSLLLLSDHPPSWGARLGGMLRHVGAARGGAGGVLTGWMVFALAVSAVGLAVAAAARWAR